VAWSSFSKDVVDFCSLLRFMLIVQRIDFFSLIGLTVCSLLYLADKMQTFMLYDIVLVLVSVKHLLFLLVRLSNQL